MTDWNVICLSPCILMLLGLALFAGYAFLDYIYGAQSAKMVWQYEIALFLLCGIAAFAASFVLDLVGDGVLEGPFFIATLAICVVTIINTFVVRRRIQSAQQVLYASPERKRAAATMLMIIGLSSLVLLAAFAFLPAATAAYKTFVVLMIITGWTIGLNTYFRTRSPLILTTTVLIAGGTSYRWDKIRFYHIATPRRYAPLILRLKGWFPLTNTMIVPLKLEEVDKMSALLAERLPAIRQSEPASSNVGDTMTGSA